MYSVFCVLELFFEIHFSYFTEDNHCVTCILISQLLLGQKKIEKNELEVH